MKTTFATIATAFIVLTSFNSFAAKKVNPLRDLNSINIVLTYLEAATAGSIEFNKFLFSDDFEYRNTANNVCYNKKTYTSFLKKNKGLRFNCETTYEMLDECGKACVAKAIMKFDNFTRIDYITLNHSQDGWKVSKVVTTYP
ncbi:hypothetical protein [Sphingobacterium haloxyli]|uniref:Nuclear transport factor 2 family protein n=1 Tax=Sphingobacterium haloxyli TaxID=2100533 RepID=A0A2S9J7A0_9SPHI|nr:hypothetical protein [Sphingobacterium haloxyli]PRD48630.1 hypothetical protein C5745_05375 [Sphingobacterium haloxyli]